jgi:uncharacterized protein YndB with AHSA1/START domain/DNA-binding transcriptional ArsR family regulator
MDAIFKALGDQTRRNLLDRLRNQDGQTLTELESVLGMSRFGVMKHLGILEAAGLIVTRKVGRFKYHYLNAAPLQLLVDRWIEPITRQPMTRALLDFKHQLEGDQKMTIAEDVKPDFVLETFIRTTPEKLWHALTDAELTKKFNIAGAAFHGVVRKGETYQYLRPDGSEMVSGKILAAIPFEKLEMTFVPGWIEGSVQPSRNIYEIERHGDMVKLTVLHFDLSEKYEGVREGWARVIASLKSLLETGNALEFEQGAK